jgi:hypothetical protein
MFIRTCSLWRSNRNGKCWTPPRQPRQHKAILQPLRRWLTSSAASFSINLFSATPFGISLLFEEELFVIGTLFVNPDNTINLYFYDPIANSSTVTAMTVTGTAVGLSTSAVGAPFPTLLPAYQFMLSNDGTTITSVTYDSQTYVLHEPIPQPFLAYLNRLPISAASNW